tara:strand:+ start:3140 stop:4426 length:1287 start_codon:yes stop_codon:yes gene_type:complete
MDIFEKVGDSQIPDTLSLESNRYKLELTSNIGYLQEKKDDELNIPLGSIVIMNNDYLYYIIGYNTDNGLVVFQFSPPSNNNSSFGKGILKWLSGSDRRAIFKKSRLRSIRIPCNLKKNLKEKTQNNNDLEILLETIETSYDFEIETEVGKIKCHKAILLAKSPLYKGIFDSGKSDIYKKGFYKQKDITHDILELIIKYFYIGEKIFSESIDIDIEKILKIIETANYLMVKSLFLPCINLLFEKLKENIGEFKIIKEKLVKKEIEIPILEEKLKESNEKIEKLKTEFEELQKKIPIVDSTDDTNNTDEDKDDKKNINTTISQKATEYLPMIHDAKKEYSENQKNHSIVLEECEELRHLIKKDLPSIYKGVKIFLTSLDFIKDDENSKLESYLLDLFNRENLKIPELLDIISEIGPDYAIKILFKEFLLS